MPTYEYVCAKCGHEFEKVQPIADKALKVCPKDVCAQKKWGRGAVKRKISTGGGLIFKGSGFYTTDYRSEGYKQSAKKESDAAKPSSGDSKTAGESKPSGDSKPSSAGEAKPAAKPESKSAKSSSAKS
jgi:putative FmdB family regulatory protein